MTMEQDRWISRTRAVLQESNVDFFRVHPTTYWFDFLLSMTLAYTAGTAFLLAPLGSPIQLLAYPLTVFWIYRLGSLVHEVCHLGQHEMRAFKVTWNLLVGVMTLAPSPFLRAIIAITTAIACTARAKTPNTSSTCFVREAQRAFWPTARW